MSDGVAWGDSAFRQGAPRVGCGWGRARLEGPLRSHACSALLSPICTVCMGVRACPFPHPLRAQLPRVPQGKRSPIRGNGGARADLSAACAVELSSIQHNSVGQLHVRLVCCVWLGCGGNGDGGYLSLHTCGMDCHALCVFSRGCSCLLLCLLLIVVVLSGLSCRRRRPPRSPVAPVPVPLVLELDLQPSLTHAHLSPASWSSSCSDCCMGQPWQLPAP